MTHDHIGGCSLIIQKICAHKNLEIKDENIIKR